jgi:hypothetical protein
VIVPPVARKRRTKAFLWRAPGRRPTGREVGVPVDLLADGRAVSEGENGEHEETEFLHEGWEILTRSSLRDDLFEVDFNVLPFR